MGKWGNTQMFGGYKLLDLYDLHKGSLYWCSEQVVRCVFTRWFSFILDGMHYFDRTFFSLHPLSSTNNKLYNLALTRKLTLNVCVSFPCVQFAKNFRLYLRAFPRILTERVSRRRSQRNLRRPPSELRWPAPSALISHQQHIGTCFFQLTYFHTITHFHVVSS